MIHAGQVQRAVEHQDAQLVGERMAALGGLSPGAVDGDGDVACESVPVRCRERQHVGRIVLPAKLPVEAADFGVIRDQAGDGPAARDAPRELAQKLAQFFAADPAGSTEQQRYVVG